MLRPCRLVTRAGQVCLCGQYRCSPLAVQAEAGRAQSTISAFFKWPLFSNTWDDNDRAPADAEQPTQELTEAATGYSKHRDSTVEEEVAHTLQDMYSGTDPQAGMRTTWLAKHAPSDEALHAFESRLGYKFLSLTLLRHALTHPSASTIDNLKLAWIGDAMLHLMCTEFMVTTYQDANVMAANNIRQLLTSRQSCEERARLLDLQSVMIYDFRQLTEPTPAMLAECFEAVLAAIYIDGGRNACYRWYKEQFPLDKEYKLLNDKYYEVMNPDLRQRNMP